MQVGTEVWGSEGPAASTQIAPLAVACSKGPAAPIHVQDWVSSLQGPEEQPQHDPQHTQQQWLLQGGHKQDTAQQQHAVAISVEQCAKEVEAAMKIDPVSPSLLPLHSGLSGAQAMPIATLPHVPVEVLAQHVCSFLPASDVFKMACVSR